MHRSHIASVAALPALLLLVPNALGQATRNYEHPGVVPLPPVLPLRGAEPGQASRQPAHVPQPRGVSTTADSQILVELAPEDTTAPNLFDLNEITLIFTPDDQGGYSRSVEPLAWEEDLGEEINEGEEVALGFPFDFGGQTWTSFYVSKHGALTFGDPLAYRYEDAANRFDTMPEIAANFVSDPTISPLFKPGYGEITGRRDPLARQLVAHYPDRVVVTWFASEPHFYAAFPPEAADRFQAVLGADGGIRFNYGFVASGDGIVGLFPHGNDIPRGNLIAAIPDGTDPGLPGHLDLLQVAIYETDADAVIVEFTTRDPVLDPEEGTRFSYRLAFDADRPYWDPDYTRSRQDADFEVRMVLRTGSDDYVLGGRLLQREGNRIALLGTIPEDLRGKPASVIAEVACFDNPGCADWDFSQPEPLDLPSRPETVDLSRPDSRFSPRHSEVFHYRSAPDTVQVACRVIDALGDVFDMFMFHNEFRIDSQENATPAGPTYGPRPEGIGVDDVPARPAPCGDGRLKKPLTLPVLSQNLTQDLGIDFLTHEFVHLWSAYLSFAMDGMKETLTNAYYRIHWRGDLHSPAAFRSAGGQESSVMGGSVWNDNGDGTFTPSISWSGLSWLDLYAMGLADASEVPDTFVLRNLEAIVEGRHNPRGETYSGGVYTGDKEIVSIEQIVAAEGLRRPDASQSQKDFNVGFVYLLFPGQTPSDHLLEAHAQFVRKFEENWFEITGGRSRITGVGAFDGGFPVAVETLADLAMHVGGVTDVDVSGTFRDPDGDPLTYGATSSTPAVASLEVSGSTVAVRAVAAGTATVTVTATDTSGSNRAARVEFRVTVEARLTFTDDPIQPGVTPVRAVHFMELRARIDVLRREAGLASFGWTDPVLLAGVTRVRLVHLTELRHALAEAYAGAGQAAPRWADAAPVPGSTTIRATHVTELRAAVLALE